MTSSCTGSIIDPESHWDTEHPTKCSSTPKLNSLELHLEVESAGISRTHVLVCDENKTVIVGFYTLAPCEVKGSILDDSRARKLPEHPIPACKLGRLAVATEFQKKGLGELLLMDAMSSFLDAAEKVGMIGLFVDAISEKAAGFYEHYGFVHCNDDPLHLFIPIQDIKAALGRD
ncbi:MAG TPA: GNAT family N-acetyltransferase [Mariprofundaceae bacterium]|nr:GNAT family N-acetyltransferase [Mariprofundaceae bacterium]